MSKKEHTVLNINDYTPKRFGLNYSPPQILIEYLVPSTGKLRIHKMRIHKLKPEKKTADIMKEWYDRHGPYLDKKKVNPNQIIKLIDKIKNNIRPAKEKGVSSTAAGTITSNMINSENINSCNKNNTKEILANMTNSKPFDKPKEENVIEKDEEEEDYGFDDFEEEGEGEGEGEGEEDLNKLNTEELNMKKNQMEVFFKKNSIKKGDENYEYDVRKDFNANQYAAEWDDDSY